MKLPKPEARKQIKRKEFKEVAKKVKQSMVAEAEYLHKKRAQNRNDPDSLNILNFY